MIIQTKILETYFDNLKRRIVKVIGIGNNASTAKQANNFGLDSNPVKGMTAIYSETMKNGKTVIIGYINRDQLAAIGETRLYSLNSSGVLQTYLWLKNNGDILIGGDADFLIGFNKTKESIDELKTSVNDLKSIFTSWTPVPNDGGAALKVAISTWAGTNLTKNIDDAKKAKIKTA